MDYDDGGVALDDTGITIRRYSLVGGSKTVPYSAIRGVRRFPLSPVRGRWRLWGSGDLRHWWNLDLRRPRKQEGLELDLGRRVLPTITPDDVDEVERLVRQHLG